ncbi:hypothetical protein VPH35_129278 [Triticum aestivum]
MKISCTPIEMVQKLKLLKLKKGNQLFGCGGSFDLERYKNSAFTCFSVQILRQAVRQGCVPQYYDDEADSRPLCDLLLFPILHWRTNDAGAALFATTPRGSLSFSSLKFIGKVGFLFLLCREYPQVV